MFQKTKKIGLLLLLSMTVVVLAGCGSKKETGKATDIKTDAKDTSAVSTPDLPEATGKVSDMVVTLENAALAEDSIIAEDESNAKTAVTDSQETSDFNQVYNEDEF